MEIRITAYAEGRIRSRKLDREAVIRTATKPQQTVPVSGTRFFAQSKYTQEGKEYLLRVLIEEIGDKLWVVTVYPTSKIRKYWQEDKS